MSAYADTGFLCSLYAPDAHTARAIARMRHQRLPLSFTWIHRLELRNALRLRVFRREITDAQASLSLNAHLADLSLGVLAAEDPDFPALLLEAERLSAAYAPELGTRSLDILHVAACLVLGNETFLTFDARQSRLARAAGLAVPEL